MNKAVQRYTYLQEPTSDNKDVPPPIKIVVMGGSVTMGINCFPPFRGRNLSNQCSWKNRLENLINHFFTHHMVEIVAIAAGGTNSGYGTRILEFDVLPPEARNADIIINAYSTNDVHVLTMIEADQKKVTLEELVFDMIQDFFRVALSPTKDLNKCKSTVPADTATGGSEQQQQQQQHHTPLVIHWNDYLGNEQNEIYGTMAVKKAVSVLSSYYGFASASSADMVRDIVSLCCASIPCRWRPSFCILLAEYISHTFSIYSLVSTFIVGVR